MKFKYDAEIRQFLRIAACVWALTAVMVGVFALAGRFSGRVVAGAVFGAAMSCLNFLALTMTVTRAAERAGDGDPKKAKAAVQGSTLLRMLILLAVYAAVLKARLCDPLAAVIPLVFVQLSAYLMEFFRRDGDKK